MKEKVLPWVFMTVICTFGVVALFSWHAMNSLNHYEVYENKVQNMIVLPQVPERPYLHFAGETSVFLIKEDNSLWAWGSNIYGRLGDGTASTSIWRNQGIVVNNNRNRPVHIMDNVSIIKSTWNSTFVIQNDGNLWAWGRNDRGQLGDGTRTDRYNPTLIMTNVAYVYPAASTTFAIKTDGSLWAWGENRNGNIGDGTTSIEEWRDEYRHWHMIEDNTRCSPVHIMDNVASVKATGSSTFAIKTDGSLWAWGRNLSGQLGDGTNINRYSPVYIMENVFEVHFLSESSSATKFATKNDGSLWAWGRDWTDTPAQILVDVAKVHLSWDATFAIQSDGTLWGWGMNLGGQVGTGSTGRIRHPARIMEDVTSVHTAHSATFAVQTDGTLWAWGSNFDRLIGDGTTANRHRPVKIMEDVILVDTSASVAFAVQSDNTLWAWGNNLSGKLGNGRICNCEWNYEDEKCLKPAKIMENVASVHTNRDITFAFQNDLSLWAWGNDKSGTIGTGRVMPWVIEPTEISFLFDYEPTINVDFTAEDALIAYNDFLLEIIATVGFRGDRWQTGIINAFLIDFDNDGIPELVIEIHDASNELFGVSILVLGYAGQLDVLHYATVWSDGGDSLFYYFAPFENGQHFLVGIVGGLYQPGYIDGNTEERHYLRLYNGKWIVEFNPTVIYVWEFDEYLNRHHSIKHRIIVDGEIITEDTLDMIYNELQITGLYHISRRHEERHTVQDVLTEIESRLR